MTCQANMDVKHKVQTNTVNNQQTNNNKKE